MSDHISHFLRAVNDDGELWQTVDVRVIAVQAENAWRNLRTQIYLRSTTPETTPSIRHPVRTGLLRAEQHILPSSAIADLLASISRGTWLDGDDGITFLTRQFENVPPVPYEFTHGQLFTLEHPLVRPHYRWSGHILQAGGDSCGTIINRVHGAYGALEGVARMHGHPFARFELLAEYVLGVPAEIAGQNAWCEVFAPYEVRIDDESVSVEGDRTHYTLVAESDAARRAARLQILPASPYPDSPLETVLLANAKWTAAAPGVWRHGGQVETGPAKSVELALHVGSQTLQWLHRRAYQSAGRPVQLAAYELVDPGLQRLERWLVGEEKRGDGEKQFVQAVGRLFHLCGWQVDILETASGEALSDAVDIIAHYSSRGICAAIECTTRSLDAGGKLGKFVARRGLLRTALAGVEVIGVVATRMPHISVSSPELQRAAADDLYVLYRELLLDMLAYVREGSSASGLLEFLEHHCRPRPDGRDLMPGLIRRSRF